MYVRVEEPLSLNVSDRLASSLDGQFLHLQLLIDILLRMKPNEKDKEELNDLCKTQYKGNEHELSLVEEFHRNYETSKAIWWYTRESFVYRVLNKALRTFNVHIIFLFRTVIRDIFEQLREHQCTERIQVYRCQRISREELNQLYASRGKFISMSSFFSTTLKRDVAMNFLKSENTSATESEDSIPITFEIVADPHILSDYPGNTRPFTNVAGLSKHEDEFEVLFMLGSVFCLNEICFNQSSADIRMPIIRMTLCSDYDSKSKQLYHYMKNKYHKEETNLLSLGDSLLYIGKFDLAEKYYRRYMTELSTDDPSQFFVSKSRHSGWFERELRYKSRGLPKMPQNFEEN